MERPLLICLTPVRNEAWILDRFLACTSCWADHIIIADQNSTDGSREIAQKYTKVILIENAGEEYNEPKRQKLLLQEARKIRGKKVLIALDADEAFVSGFSNTTDWQTILNGNKGDFFSLEWINIFPGYKKGWLPGTYSTIVFIDDDTNMGYEDYGPDLHAYPRIPNPENKVVQRLQTIKILHFQYTVWKRMQSKHRFYQCLEHINSPEKHPISIFRMYHHMYSVPKDQIINISKLHFDDYIKEGIIIKQDPIDTVFWFDEEVLRMFEEYGYEKFRKLDIWGTNWDDISNRFKAPFPKDPRNWFDKLIHIWLRHTQKYKNSLFVKRIERSIVYRFNW
jgi:glycosyltransferase involved in cell wall biosynthesis